MERFKDTLPQPLPAAGRGKFRASGNGFDLTVVTGQRRENRRLFSL